MGSTKPTTKTTHRRKPLLTNASAVLDRPIEQYLAGLALCPNEQRMSSGMVIGEQTKYVSWEIHQAFP